MRRFHSALDRVLCDLNGTNAFDGSIFNPDTYAPSLQSENRSLRQKPMNIQVGHSRIFAIPSSRQSRPATQNKARWSNQNTAHNAPNLLKQLLKPCHFARKSRSIQVYLFSRNTGNINLLFCHKSIKSLFLRVIATFNRFS